MLAVLGEQRLHRRVGEDHFAGRREERDGVLEILHDRLEVGRRGRQRLRATADSCALTASNELPRSRNSSPGSSSVTSSSPRPSRVSPLWITWIGRSIHCASTIATTVAISSAATTVPSAVLRAS